MKFSSVNILFAGIAGACLLSLVGGAGLARSSGRSLEQPASQPAKITVDYPLEGSVFPPEITPPTFLFHDPSETAKRWVIEVRFADRSAGFLVETPGEFMQFGEIDPQAGEGNAVVPFTPEQASTRTWKPDAETWAKIKRQSVKSPATIMITGVADDAAKQPVSNGSVTISTSVDPVGAPVFYRDVPLMTSPHTDKDSIQPLPTSALPLIKWRVRNIAEPQSHTVMENLYTCANCHSFSNDGKTLGIDVDGSLNDKGLYALVTVAKNMAIRNQDVIRWSSFQEDAGPKSSEPAKKRVGVMSQVSPDGRYVVTSIGPPNAPSNPQDKTAHLSQGLADRLFAMNYMDIRFTQVFYPTRGVLAWYDRKEHKLRHLPGADDPRYVQTSAFWSPDGKYLIYSRAEARDPYPPVAKKAEHANDPEETQIQYDLYKIPFNEGRGGKAEPVVGASANGMSNNFPKVSPDGRWIVFVQNKSGLLMRPDSKLYMVPFGGGKARLMNCNTSLMNSWHTFSPNGRWLAFSSKARSPYTRLMLTHIDANGNDSPAIIVDNTTAANRAVNIPEFVNVPPDGLETIEPQAMEYFKIANKAYDLMDHNEITGAIEEWHKALALDPDNAKAHFSLAAALSVNNHEREAVEEYRKACELDSSQPGWFAHLAASLAQTGDPDGAVVNYRKSLALDPSNAGAEADLGVTLFESGHTQEGYEHLKKSVDMAPDFPDGHSELGTVLAKMGRMDEAIEQLQKAVALVPTSVEYQFNLGFAMGMRGDYAAAVEVLKKAVEISEGKDWKCLDALAYAYDKTGHPAEAVQTERKALEVSAGQHDEQLDKYLRGNLERYERNGAGSQPK